MIHTMSAVSCLLTSKAQFLHLQTLRKKGFNGCDSPEPDGEDSIDQSPLNDDKYRKTTEDLDVLFKRYGVSFVNFTLKSSLNSCSIFLYCSLFCLLVKYLSVVVVLLCLKY